MRAHGIRRVVPVGDDPAFVAVGVQVLFDPPGLGAERVIDAVLVLFDAVGVEGQEMDIAQIEGLEGGVMRGDAAGFAVNGHGEVLIVGDLMGMLHFFFG